MMSMVADSEGRGFTLVEMLVVVAIISLLATLTVPTIHVVTGLVNMGVCAGNLRALHRGMVVYENEHGGKFGMWHKNFNEYSRSHHIFESIWQPHGDHLRPLGYQGLGLLVGYNPEWQGSNFYAWPPDWNRSPQAQINRFKGGGGKAPWKHKRYIQDPSVFYCPQMQAGHMSVGPNWPDQEAPAAVDNTWYSHLIWTESWQYWPDGPKNNGYTYCDYAMRPGTRVDWGIRNDRGLARSAPEWGWRGAIWPLKEYGVLSPQNFFSGEAVISDCNSSKIYVPNCHVTGTNVIYRNGGVHFTEDDGSMTTRNITQFSEGWRREGATRLVNIWALYDERYNP